jgi:hypothetical protein
MSRMLRGMIDEPQAYGPLAPDGSRGLVGISCRDSTLCFRLFTLVVWAADSYSFWILAFQLTFSIDYLEFGNSRGICRTIGVWP